MANILDIDSDCSDSEDDCDYVPEEKQLSEDSTGEDSDADEVTSPKNKGKKASSPIEEKPQLSKEEEKRRADDLFKKFMEDVDSDSKPAKKTEDSDGKVQKPEAGKITVTEEYEFAGETVKVTKEVDVSSVSSSIPTSTVSSEKAPAKDEQPKPSIPPGAIKRPGGLTSIMGKIGSKKQKISTLQKSLLDWNSFKKDEGIEEELKHHNIGKDGYIERQAFLQRTDLRQFEIERDLRMSRRK